MPDKRNAFGPFQPWIAPALGLGLVIAGIAMVAGMAPSYAPFVAAAVAGLVLLFAKWRMSRSPRP
jgi:hypothetical protein